MAKPIKASEHDRANDFRLEDFLQYRLSVATEAVSRLVSRQYLVHTGLSMPEWRLLAVVGRSGVLSPTAAGEQTSMDKVKVSRAAVGLMARGLVKQNKNPQDGRGRLLRLTRKGAVSFASIAPTARNIEEILAAGLTKADMAALHKALGKLCDHARSILANEGIDEGH